MRCWDANLSGWRRDTTSRTILHDRKCHTCGVWDLAERKRISLDVPGVLGIKNISTMVRLSIKSSLSSTAEYLTPALCFGGAHTILHLSSPCPNPVIMTQSVFQHPLMHLLLLSRKLAKPIGLDHACNMSIPAATSLQVTRADNSASQKSQPW